MKTNKRGQNQNQNQKRRTRKMNSHKKTHYNNPHITGNIIEKREGWIVLQVYGAPYQRGYAHGRLLKNEIHRTKKVFQFLVKHDITTSLSKYMQVVRTRIMPRIQRHFPEFYEEMRGIANGAKVQFDFIVAWNSYLSLYDYFLQNDKGNVLKCSAFIATGNATKHGDIVMAHTTHTNYADGQISNIVLYVSPINGNSFVMQTQPGLIASGSDWFLCSTGIIGCETTIAATKYTTKLKDLYFCRIRNAMQYATHLDEYETMLTANNGGDYASSWLLGDINTGEIMLLEIGQTTNNVERTKNGAFHGMNAPIGPNLSEFANTTEINDIETSSGARHKRFQELLHDKYKNKIDIENAKAIITDTYDVLSKEEGNPTKRTIYNYAGNMYGSIDAKVVNTEIASNLAFWGKFGTPQNNTFSIKKHIEKYPENKEWATVVDDFPKYNWTQIQR